MENNNDFISLIGKEFSGAPLGTLAAAIAIVGFIYAIMKVFTARSQTSATKTCQSYGINRFLLFFFAINIPVNKLPTISRSELIGSCLIAIVSLSICGFVGNSLLKVLNTPKDAASLFYKPTGENFYLSLKSGSQAFALRHKDSWSITPAKCQVPAEMPLTPSRGLAQLICDSFLNEEYKKDVIQAVAKFNQDKPVIYATLTLLNLSLIWFALSMVLSLVYKKRLLKYMKKEHKTAESYVS